ncbi:hypothetical protein [Bacillus paranthracis]|uniref:hypothetical protein n=1 Tax=Bacillus paranthracis TaxID=2026186 RepID=UPI0013D0FAEF|nr:hypothetical protein [Bacillus paranthracis]
MAQNLVEYHIKPDQRLTFKVAAGKECYVGQVVEVAGDMTVQPSGADSAKVLGVVYGGTVGNAGVQGLAGLPDYVKLGFSGDRKEVVTVITKGNLVYFKQPATPLAAGAKVGADAAGAYKAAGAGDSLGIVVSATSKVAGYGILALNI